MAAPSSKASNYSPPQTKPVSQWDEAEVRIFLQELTLEGSVAIFKENLVNGELLLQLEDSDLKDELLLKPVQVLRLRRELSKLVLGR